MAKKYKYYKNDRGVRLREDRIRKYYQEQNKTNEFRRKRREKIFGESETTRQEFLMSETKWQELNTFEPNIESITSSKELERRIKSARKTRTKTFIHRKNVQYKKNYQQTLDTVFKGKIDESELQSLKNKINQLNADDFAKALYTENIFNIDDFYPHNIDVSKGLTEEDITQQRFESVKDSIETLRVLSKEKK